VSGLVAIVDTNVFITARNPHKVGYAACRKVLDLVDRGDLTAIVSTVSIAEIRAGLTPVEIPTFCKAMLTHLLTSPNYRVESVHTDIVDAAGTFVPPNG
jgi:predicted nucleic acid-binding protein